MRHVPLYHCVPNCRICNARNFQESRRVAAGHLRTTLLSPSFKTFLFFLCLSFERRVRVLLRDGPAQLCLHGRVMAEEPHPALHGGPHEAAQDSHCRCGQGRWGVGRGAWGGEREGRGWWCFCAWLLLVVVVV